MAYTDVISLDEATNYLRVDDDLTEDNAAITRLINASLSFIERVTNIIVYQRNITYKMVDGCVLVYDYPINDVVTPADYDDDDTTEKTNHNIYEYGSETTDLTLDVGYTDPTNVPADLKEVALEIIELMYYGDGDFKKNLSPYAREVLNSHKRFIF